MINKKKIYTGYMYSAYTHTLATRQESDKLKHDKKFVTL